MIAELKMLIECIEEDNKYSELLILGDLNCPKVNYYNCESNFLKQHLRYQQIHHMQG